MKRTVALVAVAALAATAGCAGDDSQSSAFCSDLEAGSTPLQILGASVQDGTRSPREAANLAYGWTASSCPEQLRSNEALRSYLKNWNINPDA